MHLSHFLFRALSQGLQTLLCLAVVGAAGCGVQSVRYDGSVRDAAVASDQGPCPPGGSLCGDICVDLTNDRSNCGACGTSCPFAVQCVNARCDDGNCAMGELRCAGECANPMTSPDHCGGCNQPCDRGFACVAGRCSADTCVPGFVRCGTECTDLQVDARFCGRCDRACGVGQACVAGSCVMSMCRDGLTQCGPDCTDLRFDPRHCGSCVRSCPAEQRCSLGMCEEVPCSGNGMTRCDQLCVNSLTDPANCGRCRLRCASGVCSNGVCRADALRPRWAVSFGTVGEDTVKGISLDGSNNVYVVGSYDGPLTLNGRLMLTPRGRTDVFVASYTADGTLRWIRGFGGRGADQAQAVVAANNGLVYIVGYYSGEFVSATQGNVAGPGQLDAFVLALDQATGTERAFASIGGVGFEVLSSVAFADGRLVVGGWFSEEITIGGTRLVSSGRDDVLLVSLEPNLLRPIWARGFGGINDDHAYAVQLDVTGRVFVGGGVESSFAWGRSRLMSLGESDGFVAATDSVGTPLWAERFGGAQSDSVQGLTLDGMGGVMATGFFRGTAQYPMGLTIAARGSDVIAFPLSGDGIAGMPHIWGSLNDDTGYAIARGRDGRWMITGTIRDGADFGLGPVDTYFLSADAFAAGFDANWMPRSVPTVQGVRNDNGYAVAIATDSTAYWGGSFTLGGNLGLGFVDGAGGSDGFIVAVGQ